MELFNTIIATLGLILSIIALVHSIYYNLVKIKLSNCTVDSAGDSYDQLYEFDVSNLSNVAVIIKKIELFDKQGNLLKDNGFDPFKQHELEKDNAYSEWQASTSLVSMPPFTAPLDPGWKSQPFTHETEIFPASRETFSYYLDQKPAKIKITTNKRIYKFRKSQSFIPHFDDND